MANGLINLQTDLKSLRYGSDKPYVTKNIGEAPGSQIGREVQHRIDDTSRIAQMLIDKPGIKYLLGEAQLQQINVADKIKKAKKNGKTTAGAILQQLSGTLLKTTQVAASTLAQVPVNGTGTHFIKGFRTDTFLLPEGGNTRSAFAQFFGAGGVEGAPYAIEGAPVPAFSTLDNPVLVQTTMSPTDGSSLIQGKPNTGYFANGARQLNANPSKTYSEDKPYEEVVGKRLLTFENEDRTVKSTKQIKKESRVNLGDQGARNDFGKYTNKYWTVSNSGDEVDKINYLPPVTEKVVGEVEGRDLVKFRFHVLTPRDTKILYFRAFLDSFDDNFSGIWNPIRYLGRAEELQVYGGFQRKISLSFKVAAATRSEMRPLYQKMMYLASATAPTYAVDKQFMQGTIIKVTVGNYIYELPGVLNNVAFTWQTDYPWEIAMTEPENENGDEAMQELPMVLDCKLDFTPIHSFTPETGLKKYFTAGTAGKLNDYTKLNVADVLAGKQSSFSGQDTGVRNGIEVGPEASPLYSPEFSNTQDA
jgi:hypothetical protein